jgi:hypothetical protein
MRAQLLIDCEEDRTLRAVRVGMLRETDHQKGASPLDEEQEWERWRTWLGEEPKNPSIYQDVVSMYAARAVWWGFNVIYGNAPDEARTNPTFQQWIATNYYTSQAIGIRRQADLRTDVMSLGALIKGVADAPEVLSRARFIDARGNDDQASRDFDTQIGAGLDHIDPAIPLDDLKLLRDETQSVRAWATKEVAHYDLNKGTFEVGLTFGHLHSAVDLVGELFQKYYSLIRATHVLLDKLVMPPWPVIFRVAWIPNEERMQTAMTQVHDGGPPSL